MKKLIRALILASVAVISAYSAAQQNPDEVLKSIQELRTARITEARTNKTNLDSAAMQRDVLAKAKAALVGVDVKKVDAKACLAWAQVASMADEHHMACDFAAKYLSSSPSDEQKFTAQILMMDSCAEQGEAANIVKMLADVNPSNKNNATMLLQKTANYYADTINEKMGVDKAIKAIETAEKKMPYAEFTTTDEKKQIESVRYAVASAKFGLLKDAGKKDRALKVLDAALKDMDPASPNTKRMGTLRNQLTILNNPAPALRVERGYGNFPGLESLKGKVVLVDFFAHWCGPCKASFPEMEKLYADLHDQGLEIVGATRYYGYYGAERNLSKDDEYAKMQGFIAEHKLPWPIVYVDNDDFSAYGVTGIPHVAVIDKKGAVHKIKIGYDPSSFAAFRAEVEKLLKD